VIISIPKFSLSFEYHDSPSKNGWAASSSAKAIIFLLSDI
jgi:hypothetical protein